MVLGVLEYAGQKVRSSDLFGNETPIAMTKKFLKGLKVNNRYWCNCFMVRYMYRKLS